MFYNIVFWKQLLYNKIIKKFHLKLFKSTFKFYMNNIYKGLFSKKKDGSKSVQ